MTTVYFKSLWAACLKLDFKRFPGRQPAFEMSSKQVSGLAWCLVPVLMLVTSDYRYALAEAARPIEITLCPSCTAVDDVVLMSHIAQITSTTESLRELIASLDIADSPKANETIEITAKRVDFRLRLAGIDPRLVSLHGLKTEVRRSEATAPTAKIRTVAEHSSKIRPAVHRPASGESEKSIQRPAPVFETETVIASPDQNASVEDMVVDTA